MSNQERPDWRWVVDDQEEWPEPNADELRRLEEHLDQLEKEGVLIKGDGVRGSLRTVAHVPGALERFLAERDKGR